MFCKNYDERCYMLEPYIIYHYLLSLFSSILPLLRKLKIVFFNSLYSDNFSNGKQSAGNQRLTILLSRYLRDFTHRIFYSQVTNNDTHFNN